MQAGRLPRRWASSEEEQQAKFGFLLDALQMGAPPHGGFAMGIDRFVARMAGEPDIRQVIAFPKVASGGDPLTGAPDADAGLRPAGARDPLDRRARVKRRHRPPMEKSYFDSARRASTRSNREARHMAPKARVAQASRR